MQPLDYVFNFTYVPCVISIGHHCLSHFPPLEKGGNTQGNRTGVACLKWQDLMQVCVNSKAAFCPPGQQPPSWVRSWGKGIK